jgi:hypothetical protein
LSAYSIARQHVEGALADAKQTGVDPETLLRALLATMVEHYRELKGPDDVRAVLQYQIDNCRGDEDHMFMRP